MSIDETIRNQIAENMRFYADMRFKQLTLLMAAMTLATAGVAQYPETLLTSDISVRNALAVASMLFISVLWVMEVRSTMYWVAHREAASELWPSPKKCHMKLLNATNCVFLLHAGLYSSWLWFSHEWGLIFYWQFILIAIGGALLLFTTLNYWHIWTNR